MASKQNDNQKKNISTIPFTKNEFTQGLSITTKQ